MSAGVTYRGDGKGKAHRPVTVSLFVLGLHCEGNRQRGNGGWWHGPASDVPATRLCRRCFPGGAA